MTGLRKEARKIENEIDNKLLMLSKCDQSSLDDEESSDKAPLLVSTSTTGLFERLGREIEVLLSRLTDVNQEMASISEHIRSPSATYTLQRHRDILNDYSKEFRKTKANIESNHVREQLFFSSDTSKQNTTLSETRIQMHSKTSDLLNKELESARKYVLIAFSSDFSVDSFLLLVFNLSTELLVDEQIDTVLRTRESLMNQKAALKAIHSQMTTLASELRLPLLETIA